MLYYYDTFSTPVGDFSAAVDETGALATTAFGGKKALLARFSSDARVRDGDGVAASAGASVNASADARVCARAHTRAGVFESALTRAPAKLAAVRAQVDEYFAGTRRDFDLTLAPAGGSEHQRRVRAALLAIPFGETRSYGELAKKLGSSPRAVGRANATNPISLIVPCHRVIGADGSLTGYAFGESIKRRLLAHEGACLPVDAWAPSQNKVYKQDTSVI